MMPLLIDKDFGLAQDNDPKRASVLVEIIFRIKTFDSACTIPDVNTDKTRTCSIHNREEYSWMSSGYDIWVLASIVHKK